MIKKVQFPGRRNGPAPAVIDQWVQNRGQQPAEPTKRLTVDVPLSLHRRMKIQCTLENRIMADVVRDLLYERFGESDELPAVARMPVEEGAAS